MRNLLRKPELNEFEVEGETLWARPITAGQLAEVMHFAELCKADNTPWRTDFRLISMSVCDREGKPCLTEADAESLSPKVAAVLLAKVCEVNGLGGLDEKKESSATTPPSA